LHKAALLHTSDFVKHSNPKRKQRGKIVEEEVKKEAPTTEENFQLRREQIRSYASIVVDLYLSQITNNKHEK
jgi:translation elongation factor EF-Ts